MAAGVVAAVWRDGPVDIALAVLSSLGISSPAFLTALIVLFVFAVRLGWAPTGGMATPGVPVTTFDVLRHLALPALVLTIAQATLTLRYMRAAMLEEFGRDYMRTARAKGVTERRVIAMHALRNALLPVVTLIGANIGAAVGGAIFVESVFNWPGHGPAADQRGRAARLSADHGRGAGDRRVRAAGQPGDRPRVRGDRSAHPAAVIAADAPWVRAALRFARQPVAMTGLVLLLLVLVGICCIRCCGRSIRTRSTSLALNAPPGAGIRSAPTASGATCWRACWRAGAFRMLVACGSVAIATVIGFLVGAIAALGGRVANAVAMRLVDLAMTLPPVVLLLVLASIVGQGILPTILVIALLSWPVLARVTRARLLEVREREFVIAAHAMGAGFWHVLRRHALPNSIDILVVYVTLQIANAVLLEAGLSFLGLGIPPPAASWGNMLNAARSTVVLEQYPWQWLAPGGALLLTALAINFVGDGLRAALDPRTL